MIGRNKEIAELEQLYQKCSFQYAIMYGEYGVGKTSILLEFARRHSCLFFSAREKNDALNLRDFSKAIQIYFDGSSLADFKDWKTAFDYISLKSEQKKTVIIIDEFPLIAETNPSIKSMLQHQIDKDWKNRNLMLVLCGSSASFMVNEVMGYKSPLYGRSTSVMKIEPFDYFESAEFVPHFSVEEKLLTYGILGGIPKYLATFNDQLSFRENLIRNVIAPYSPLYDEPQTALKTELREPAVYNSILEAISNGKNRVIEISETIHEEQTKCGKYIATLQQMGLVTRLVPCGESEKSKKAIYIISDHFYRFWYRTVFTNGSYYQMLGTEKAAKEILSGIHDYMGPIFEEICQQYMVIQAKKGTLPFVPYSLGRWWGNNPVIKAQDDVDLLALDKTGEKAIFAECKFQNRPMPMSEYDDLITASLAFPQVKEKTLMFFSLSGYTSSVERRAAAEGTILLSADDLFD